MRVEPAIMAYDQDTGINARLRYSIILGNEGGFFEMNAQTGEIFLIREIDLEKLTNPTLSLQIQASQVDNPFRQALARVDISVQDINDNSPEVSSLFFLLPLIPTLPHQEVYTVSLIQPLKAVKQLTRVRQVFHDATSILHALILVLAQVQECKLMMRYAADYV